MITIGNAEFDARVFKSSNGSYNFTVPYNDLDRVKNAFAGAESVSFPFGQATLVLFSPILQIIQIVANVVTVIFTAQEIPQNEQEALKERATALEEQNAQLNAELIEAEGTIAMLEDAIVELAEIIGGEEA